MAFSGTITEGESKDYTEEGMNGIKGGELPETFDKNDDIKILVVAENIGQDLTSQNLCYVCR